MDTSLWPFSAERELTRKMESNFTWTCSDKTRGNVFKLKEGRFRLDVRKKFFYSECCERCWNRLPRVIVDDPSLEAFRSGWMGSWAV